MTKQEIELWELVNPEIYEYVKGNEIWFDPQSGEKLAQCPFLETVRDPAQAREKYTCSIYKDRPEDCRLYPSTINEMIRDGCEMIEKVDLDNPITAQKKLDLIMIDSRPGKI